MLSYRSLYTLPERRAEPDQMSFVVDVKDLGVLNGREEGSREKSISCKIYVVTGPEMESVNGWPERSHWID